MAAEARRLRQELAPGKDAVQPSGPPARQISDAPPAEDARQALQRYEEAKKTMELLRADKRRSCWREPWENLRGDFLQVYQSRPGATISAAALFRAGVSARALADCSPTLPPTTARPVPCCCGCRKSSPAAPPG